MQKLPLADEKFALTLVCEKASHHVITSFTSQTLQWLQLTAAHLVHFPAKQHSSTDFTSSCYTVNRVKQISSRQLFVTYAQKSSTVLNVVITFWLSSQLFRLSFLKYHSAHVFCSGCLMSSSGSTVSSAAATDGGSAALAVSVVAGCHIHALNCLEFTRHIQHLLFKFLL